jgi:hypothetical protein
MTLLARCLFKPLDSEIPRERARLQVFLKSPGGNCKSSGEPLPSAQLIYGGLQIPGPIEGSVCLLWRCSGTISALRDSVANELSCLSHLYKEEPLISLVRFVPNSNSLTLLGSEDSVIWG